MGDNIPHVVIVGGGFGGLATAKALRNAPVHVTLIDRSNHHLFQPLLYQVATSVLASGQIGSPIRNILRNQRNTTTILGEVSGLDAEKKCVFVNGADRSGVPLPYDFLVLATGVTHSYFGHDEFAAHAPGLKTVADAVAVRNRILQAFEQAEAEEDPNNDDPHFLTEAMRNNARPRFLAAGAGMTGGNFAIAETGTFVVCTNEGNADIGAAVPPLHIASIGIEKMIPRVEDMGVFLRLLTRSALGKPATQYASHFTGPRKGGELHIVLVDNGRSRRLGMADFWHSLKCIRCSACMNTCPVYRRSGNPPQIAGTTSGVQSLDSALHTEALRYISGQSDVFLCGGRSSRRGSFEKCTIRSTSGISRRTVLP